jgi:glycosyltransferase involved in cell wall biosynthesis
MHICYLTPEYPHPRLNSSGGLGSSIKNLAEQLVQEGIRVTVVVTGQETDEQFKANGIDMYVLAHIKYPLGGFWWYRKHVERYLNRLIKREKIDLVEAPDWTGITAFMRLNAPLMIRFNGSDAYFCHLDGRPQKWENRLLEQLALKKADHLLSVSAFTAELTKDLFKLPQPIAVIPNSIDINHFTPSPEEELPNRVLYFGTLIRKKGVLELAAICNEINAQSPETSFMFAGRDVPDIFTGESTQAMIQQLMTAQTLAQTQFLGALPYDQIQQEIAKATVVVLPSFAEALPMTWLEAMAMEKALVTSDIGWAKEVMVEGETGFTVSPNNHQLYAERVVRLLQNQVLRKSMGRQARARVRTDFATTAVIAKNIAYYRSILNHAVK